MITLSQSQIDPRAGGDGGGSTAPATPTATEVVMESLEHPITDLHGAPLPIGCAIELGFFSRGQMATPFRGKWTPLSGRFSTDTNRRIHFPRIGDGGSGPGCFSWRHTFPHGLEVLAPVNTPLAIRFYDHPEPQAARNFASVSNPSWWCRPPKAGTPALIFMSLDFEGTVWEGGPRDAFRAALPVFGSMFSRLMAIGDAPESADL